MKYSEQKENAYVGLECRHFAWSVSWDAPYCLRHTWCLLCALIPSHSRIGLKSSRDFVIFLFLTGYNCGSISKIWPRRKKQSILISRVQKMIHLGLRSVCKTLGHCSTVGFEGLPHTDIPPIWTCKSSM